MAALRLIPGVTLDPVVASAQILNVLYALWDHAGVEHQGRGRMLLASPGLGVVRKGNMRPRRLTVIADHHGSFIIQRIGTLHGVMVHQAALVVVAINGFQRGAYMLWRNQWPKPGY